MQWAGGVSQHAMGVYTPLDTRKADSPSETATEAGGTHPTGMHSHFFVSNMKLLTVSKILTQVLFTNNK